MAIVTRYFSTASAGANDGTSWANRAVLFSGGAWSTIITGFSFAGADSLLCYIGPGSYAITATLTAAPSDANPLMFHGCDSGGIALTPPDPDWVSAAAPWSDTDLPVLATTTNMFLSTSNPMFYRLMKITVSGVTSAPILQNGSLNWCSIVQSNSTTTAHAIDPSFHSVTNCLISMTGSSFSQAVICGGANPYFNNRLIGVTGASGNRNGFDLGNTTGPAIVGCTIVGFGGNGIGSTASSTAAYGRIMRCSCIGNGVSGIKLPATAGQTEQHVVVDCLSTGNGVYGIDGQSAARIMLSNNRTRDNISGDGSGTWGNYQPFGNYTTDDADATEFVNSAIGDYRIVNTAPTWGKNFGAGDGPAPGGGASGGLISHPGMTGNING